MLKTKPMPDRIEVNSSTIKSIGYDKRIQLMQVEFHGNKGKPSSLYNYHPVTEETYIKVMTAKSVGSEFARTIKADTNIAFEKIQEVLSDKE